MQIWQMLSKTINCIHLGHTEALTEMDRKVLHILRETESDSGHTRWHLS